HHADDGDRSTVELNGFADDGRIAAEPSGPETVAQHDLTGIRRAGESPAERWMSAEQREQTRRYLGAVQPLGATARDPHRRCGHESRDGIHRSAALPPGEEGDRRHHIAIALSRDV